MPAKQMALSRCFVDHLESGIAPGVAKAGDPVAYQLGDRLVTRYDRAIALDKTPTPAEHPLTVALVLDLL